MRQWLAAVVVVVVGVACSDSSGGDNPPTQELGVGSVWQGTWGDSQGRVGVATLSVQGETPAIVSGTLSTGSLYCSAGTRAFELSRQGSGVLAGSVEAFSSGRPVPGEGLDVILTVGGSNMTGTFAGNGSCALSGTFDLDRVFPARAPSWTITQPEEGVLVIRQR